MYKVEIIKEVDSTQLYTFLKSVKFTRFHLFPNTGNSNLQKYLFGLISNRLKDLTVFSYSENSKIICLIFLQILDWDSNHFGFKCASINEIFYDSSVNNEELKKALNIIFSEIEKEAYQNGIKFMSVSVNAFDSIVSNALQYCNFKFILTWINGLYDSGEKIKLNDDDFEIGLIKESEVGFYKDLAARYYFKGGRFYLDKNFDTSLVDSMYASLIEASFKNDDIMLSCRSKSKSLGLFICRKIMNYSHFNNLRVAPLRYLIIDPEVRQKLIGYKLFAGTINFLQDKCDIITTGLEVHNLPSLNLHTKLGFKFNYTHNLFHWWSSEN